MQKSGHDGLRSRAKARLARRPPGGTPRQSVPEDVFHELQVHQVELELQNEELRRARNELEEARDRYLELYDFAPVGYVTLDQQDRIVEINLTAAGLLGLDRAELLSRPFLFSIDPQDRDRWGGHLERVLAGEQQSCELLMLQAGGGRFPALLTTTPVERGASRRARCTLVDISDRVRFEEERRIAEVLEVNDRLRQTQLKLVQAVHVAQLGIWEWEPSTDEVAWNEEMFQIYGLRPEEFTRRGIDFFDFTRDECRDAQRASITAAIEAGSKKGTSPSSAAPGPVAQELRIRRRDGSDRFILGNAVALPANHREALRVLGVTVDITELRSAQSALADSEARFRRLAEEAVLGIYVIQGGKLAYVNPSLARILGYRPEEIAGRKAPEELFRPADGEPLLERLDAATGGQPIACRGVKKDGSEIEVEVYGAPVEHRGERALQGTVIDVTARRSLERQLAQAQKMESVGRLAGGVAHDFNNMLCVIGMASEAALARLDDDDPLRAELEEVRAASQRSAELTRQLLAFARMQPAEPRVLDLNETVDGMLRMLRRLVGENLTLAWRPGEVLWPVHLDPSQVDQVLANLCINARDAISGVGTITIETSNRVLEEDPGASAAGDYACLTVTDTGRGMDEETRAHAFDPFFTTKEVGKGTGLGLATVYGIVEQNGGHIDVRSAPGKGTSIGICLPRYQGEDVEGRPAGRERQAPRGDETLVLVDDEPAVLRVNTRLLRSLGYTVLTATTPGEAMQLAREHAGEVHLLVTDLLMPQQNGAELARDFLALRPQARCLFMSGYAADVVVPDSIEAGAAFLQKPFTAAALASSVRSVLDAVPDRSVTPAVPG